MLDIVRSELLKMRHTFSLKLVILAPLVMLLSGYLLSGSYVQLSAYNWWYSMILPLVVSLCSASMIVREKKTGMQNIICLPVRFDKIWLGNVAEQELQAGHFQNMLTLSSRKKAIFSKFAVLLLSGLFSVILSTVLFGIPFSYITGMKFPVGFFSALLSRVV